MMTKNKWYLALLLLVVTSLILTGCYGPGMTPAGFGGVVTDGTNVYLGLNNFVHAVKLSDHTEAWRYPAKADAKKVFFATPALTSDGQLIIGSYNHSLYSINTETGSENWNFAAKSRFIAGPLVLNDVIYAPNDDGNLYAVDLQGNEVWQAPFNAGGQIWSTPATAPDCNCLYVASMNHFVYSVNIANGQQIWKSDLGGSVVGTPAVGDGKLYIGSFNNEMLALDSANGNILWRHKTDGGAWAGPSLNKAGDTLYFGDTKGSFYALSAADGSPVWGTVEADGSITSTPSVTEDHVYFTTDAGTIYALNLDGSIDWKQTIMDEKGKAVKLFSTPMVQEDKIVVVTSQASNLVLVAFDAKGKSESWRFDGRAPAK